MFVGFLKEKAAVLVLALVSETRDFNSNTTVREVPGYICKYKMLKSCIFKNFFPV